MYKLHLILKYLRKRRIAWVSLIAVMLCTAMVLVVISVMGGWLNMFRESVRGLSGDVLIESKSLAGFPYYQEVIERVQKMPDIEAAAPVIQTFGLFKVGGIGPKGVQVVGYDLNQIGKVNIFPQSLYRQAYGKGEKVEKVRDPSMTELELEEEMQDREEVHRMAEQTSGPPSFAPFLPAETYRGRGGKAGDPSKWPGMIVGTGVVGIRKAVDNSLVGRVPAMYDMPANLTLLEIDPRQSRINPENVQSINFWIVDDARTKVYESDVSTVYVDFAVLQKYLGMNGGAEWTNQKTGKTEIEPARTSSIHVKAKPGVLLAEALVQVQKAVDEVMDQKQVASLSRPDVQTWEQRSSDFINAVEHEKLLLLVLFGIISIVAVFLIFCIFYMIVAEKTRDIGIIKSVGATSAGVAGIFLGYGLTIGVVGASMGLLIGYAIVHNINWLHTQLGLLLHVQIWNPKVYMFDTIPNRMDPVEVTVIVAVAILSSVLGALVPAIRAARMHPIEALRWE